MALAQGVVDGVFTTLPPSVGEKQHEQYKYVAEIHTSMNLRTVILSEKWFQSLSPEEQVVALKVGWEAAQMMRYTPSNQYYETRKFVLSKGIQITNPPIEEFKAAWYKALPGFYDSVGGKWMVDVVEIEKQGFKAPKLEK